MIKTERLKIYTASKEAMEKMIESQTDDEMIKAYSEMLDGCLKHLKQWEWYAAWIIELEDGTLIGDLCFKGITQSGSVEIGYGISDEFQGRGYGTEAVDAAAAWALEQPSVTCVEAEIEPCNTASQRVLEKCGFVPNGVMGEEGPRFMRKRSET